MKGPVGRDWPSRAVRVVVPLFDTSFVGFDDIAKGGRLQVTPWIVLAALNDEEGERVRGALLEEWSPRYRLELHDVEAVYDPEDRYFLDPRVVDQVERTLGLLSCVVRLAPRWPTVVCDIRDGNRWVRANWVPAYGGSSPLRHSAIPASRLRTWSTLLTNWPSSDLVSRVDLALGFYYQSIIDRPEEPYKALASAAISFETLLGGQIREELTHRMSQRGALLVESGQRSMEVYSRVKGWYGTRSRLVHAGVMPTDEPVIRLQQFLMRAIPSMARLCSSTGAYQSAVQALDDAAFYPHSARNALFEDDPSWWRYVNVLAAWQNPAL